MFWNQNETINTIKIYHINATNRPIKCQQYNKGIKACLNNINLKINKLMIDIDFQSHALK